ncbi:o-succinylbenzoate- ligase (plasmid) [Paraburkholderia caribensis MBA4]|uniref:O-succinylbenzoate-ligase n=1 Tax=Paraburkholderia caribensis MBA4 TaxID=1323664 RepID=A0A0P0RLP9_9BURK|nr:o-succinylbenzoate- ligase [Paraburkholderia caribensis MBA4]
MAAAKRLCVRVEGIKQMSPIRLSDIATRGRPRQQRMNAVSCAVDPLIRGKKERFGNASWNLRR